jgi:hypothetical protein
MPAEVEISRVVGLPEMKLREAATLIADAFVDHPFFARAFPSENVRLEASRALFVAALKDGMQHGIVDVACEDRVVGVMLSYAPGCYPPTLGRVLRQWRQHFRIASLSLFGLLRLFATQSRLESLHPDEPHYHVFAIATDTARKGVANRLAARLFAIADGQGKPVYAETQQQETLEWGIRLGFTMLRENVAMYPGGPKTWTLWREPGAGASRVPDAAQHEGKRSDALPMRDPGMLDHG